jgi:hypothetical protein
MITVIDFHLYQITYLPIFDNPFYILKHENREADIN